MTKTFCDRCGKEIKTENGLSVYAWLRHRVLYAKLRISSDNMVSIFDETDKYICPECEDSYIHWFMNPENGR